MGDNVIPDIDVYSREQVDESLEGVQGNHIIGTLDDELISLYVRLTNAELELDDMSSEMTKRFIQASMNNAIDALNDTTTFAEIFQKVQANGWFQHETEAEEIFEKMARWDQLRGTFWYDVRSTFKTWNSWLEIRQGFRVVTLGKKFEKPA